MSSINGITWSSAKDRFSPETVIKNNSLHRRAANYVDKVISCRGYIYMYRTLEYVVSSISFEIIYGLNNKAGSDIR